MNQEPPILRERKYTRADIEKLVISDVTISTVIHFVNEDRFDYEEGLIRMVCLLVREKREYVKTLVDKGWCPWEAPQCAPNNWVCGCGTINGVNLATCRVCGRREGELR